MALPTVLNNFVATLAVRHLPGSARLELRAGAGADILARVADLGAPAPAAGSPLRLTVARADTLVGGEIVAGSTYTIYDCTSLIGDILSGLSAVEGTADREYARGDRVESAITAGVILGIRDALADAASADDVVKVTGAQQVAGVKTLTDTLVHDLVANTSGVARRILPAAHSVSGLDNVSWSDGMSSQANTDGTSNQVTSAGFHITAAGTSIDDTRLAVRFFACEHRYRDVDHDQTEGHWLCMHHPDEPGVERRVLTATARHDNKKAALSIAASNFSNLDESNNQLALLAYNGSDTLTHTYVVGGVIGHQVSLAPGADGVSFGRTTTTSSTANIKGHTVSFEFINDTATWGLVGSTGSPDLLFQVDGWAGINFRGGAGTVGQIRMTGQASSNVGLDLNTNGKAGYVNLDGSGNLLLVQHFSSTLYLGGTFTTYVTSAGSLVVGGGAALQKFLSATASLDFGSIAAGGQAELTLSVAGAAVGDTVSLGAPAAIESGLTWAGRVSAADTVTIRLTNPTAGAIDPAAATWRATAIKF